MSHGADPLAGVADRASFLWERLRGGYAPTGAADAEEVERRLARWRQTVAKGDADVFARRLAWDGITEDHARAMLGPVAAIDPPNESAWVGVLRELVRATHRRDRTPPPAGDGPPVPFADVVWPIVRFAREALDMRRADVPGLLLPRVWDDLESSFAGLVGRLLTPTLYDEFDRLRASQRTLLDQLRRPGSGPAPTARYRAFVDGLLADGLAAFFDRYPVLARLVATAVTQWVDGTALFLGRLAADRDALAAGLGQPDATGPVERIRAGASDPHNGGLGVVLVRFASGGRVVYKPKELATDAGFWRVVEWVNAAGVLPPLRTPRVLQRDGYGWAEFITDAPCPDRAAVGRYFQRAGGLLALAYVLGTNDLHYENMIAAGEFPVLIDTETVLHHRTRFLVEDERTAEYSRGLLYALGDSVLRTGLLPQWVTDPTGRNALDLSALGFVGDMHVYGDRTVWEGVNTDDMRQRVEAGTLPPALNAAALDGRTLTPDEFTDELTDGFGRVYRLLADRRGEFAAADGPVAGLGGVSARFIFRSTRNYLAMLDRLLRPEFLGDGAVWGIEVEAFARPHLTGTERPVAWPVFAGEAVAVGRGDVPCFTARADSDALTGGVAEPIPGYFLESATAAVRQRLAGLSEADLAVQTALIRGSLDSCAARNSGPVVGATAVAPADAPLPADELRAEAAKLADDLRRAAVRGPDGTWNWLGLAFMPAVDRYQLTVLGDGLYYGRAGVALFLAAAGHGDLAIETLAPGRDAVRRLAADPGDVLPWLGTGNGVGSAVYAFTRVGRLLGDTSVLDDARLAASLVTDAVVAADRYYDVLNGAAGSILALLALHAETGDRDVLAAADRCGRHLLDRADRPADGHLAWPSLEEKAHAGFAHGAAGIACALARLAAVTGDDAFRAGAAAAVAFEASLFDPAVGEWADQRAAQEGVYPVSWCYGGPGIALARAGGLAGLDSAAVRADIAAGVASTRRAGMPDVEYLCCGRLGRAEVLAEVGRRADRPDWTAEAARTTAALVQAARAAGGYRLFKNRPATVGHPGLFQGTAGIGYHLLRMADPARVPSALSFD